MAKIKFNRWQMPIKFEESSDGYKIKGVEWWKTTSEHGRSRGKVKCPCCDSTTEIYVWSFIGSGKRCNNCNVLLGASSAFLYGKEITNSISVKDTFLIKTPNA